MNARTKALLMSALILGSVLTALPAAAAGEDCGSGRDTPPPIHIASGEGCSGTHDGESYNFDSVCTWWCAKDTYTFTAHQDDLVRVFFLRSCASTMWAADVGPRGQGGSADFVAGRSGTSLYTLTVYSLSGFDGGGCWGTTSYFISVSIIPNERPVITSVEGPDRALPGDTYTFQIFATDIDNNLKEVGARFSLYESVWSPVGSGGSGVLDLSFNYDRSFALFAGDSYGAVSDGVDWSVSLYEDDCSSGGDIDIYPIPFGGSCRAHLARALGDEHDGFTFEVPAGLTGRLAFEYARSSGGLEADLTFTSPSGNVITAASDSLFLPDTEAGLWRVDLNRKTASCCVEYDPYVGGYDFRTRTVGGQAPPVVTGEASPNNIHRYESTTLTFSAIDPNDEYVSFAIDWGDGQVEAYRDAKKISSGATASLTHTFETLPTSQPKVIATNDEGLATTFTVPLTVRAPDDWCLGNRRDVRDAPSYTTGWTKSDQDHYEIVGKGHCDGELGFALSKSSSGTTTDLADVYHFWGCVHLLSGCYSETRAGTTVTIRITTGSVGVRASVDLIGEERGTMSVGPNSSATMSLISGHYLLHSLIIDKPSGEGSYSIDISPSI